MSSDYRSQVGTGSLIQHARTRTRCKGAWHTVQLGEGSKSVSQPAHPGGTSVPLRAAADSTTGTPFSKFPNGAPQSTHSGVQSNTKVSLHTDTGLQHVAYRHA
jgi:hypothetical protein